MTREHDAYDDGYSDGWDAALDWLLQIAEDCLPDHILSILIKLTKEEQN